MLNWKIENQDVGSNGVSVGPVVGFVVVVGLVVNGLVVVGYVRNQIVADPH